MICSASVDCRRARVSEILGDFTPILQPSSVVNPGMRFDGSVIYRVNSVSNSRCDSRNPSWVKATDFAFPTGSVMKLLVGADAFTLRRIRHECTGLPTARAGRGSALQPVHGLSGAPGRPACCAFAPPRHQ